MPDICPTVTATEPHAYREQLTRAAEFADRVHIDIADGVLAPVKLLDPFHIWLPDNVICDIHVMYQKPQSIQRRLLDLKPNLVVLHAEADGEFEETIAPYKAAGIKVGLALLQQTPVEAVLSVINGLDHVLVFSGNLGHHGGVADLSLLDKVQKLKTAKPDIEIGWDGGINDENIVQLVEAGVEALNVGGFIQKTSDPKSAYAKLKSLIQA